jgi:hypothetical protein
MYHREAENTVTSIIHCWGRKGIGFVFRQMGSRDTSVGTVTGIRGNVTNCSLLHSVHTGFLTNKYQGIPPWE